MNTMIGNDFGTIAAVAMILLGLSITSYFFDKRIERDLRNLEGWTWVLVAIGCFYTQIAVGFLDLLIPQWNAFILGMMAYCFSGLPMAWGAYLRHREASERARKAANE